MLELLTNKKIKCSVDSHNFTVTVPRSSNRVIEILKKRIFSSEAITEAKQLFHLLNEPKVILDIGANLGYQTLFYYYVTNPDKIFCFEPSHYNFRYLEKNCSDLRGVELYNYGFSEKNESLFISMPNSNQNKKISRYKNHTGYMSLYGEGTKHRFEASLKKIDFWQEKLKNTQAFIKIDVEGHELKCLQGAQELLKDEHIYHIEFNPITLKMSKTNPEEIIKHMKKFNYLPYVHKDNSLAPLSNNLFDRVIDIIFIKKG